MLVLEREGQGRWPTSQISALHGEQPTSSRAAAPMIVITVLCWLNR
jgi:hypothetical protein